MINNLRFELSFKNISQLEKKLNFCKLNKIKKINIPCKGTINKDFLNSTIKYISKNFQEFDITYHYSLYHQYYCNKEKSYQDLLNFLNNSYSNKNYKILIVSGSNKRERFERKLSSKLINSIWFQYGTDIKVLQNEVNYLKEVTKYEKIDLFGSLLIPSKQFIARFKFRPWKGVYISERYLCSLDDFYGFTRDLVSFYKNNNITPVVETDFASSKKLDSVYSFFSN